MAFDPASLVGIVSGKLAGVKLLGDFRLACWRCAFHIKPMKHLILLSLLLTSPAWAADAPSDKGTLISLEASASIELPNDELIALYRVEATGTNAGQLRQQVNRTSQAINARLKKEKALKLTTLSRRMEMLWRYDKISRKQLRDGWKLVQREQVTSKALDAAADWIDAIEKAGAHLDNLSFRISESSSSAAQQSLRLQALANFRARATTLAKALDAPGFRIVTLQTSSQRPVYPMRREMAMMKASDAAAPSFNSGEGKISVNVSGQIRLPVRDFPVQ